MRKLISGKIIVILAVALLLGLFNSPPSFKEKYMSFLPDSVKSQHIHLGLDLQGGSQLDYKIDLRKVPAADRKAIVDGVFGVIEKRVNGLGVAEPNIFLSEVADEQHIIVELAGIKDLEEAKQTVGKTIQLEFKEQKEEMDPYEKDKRKAHANDILTRINEGEDFELIGQEEAQAEPGKTEFQEVDFVFESELSNKTKEDLEKLDEGEVSNTLTESSGEYTVSEQGQLTEKTGYNILKLLETKKEIRFDKELDVSHILVSYQGAEEAVEGVTRTEEEAREVIKEIQEKLAEGGNFAGLAKEYSDDSASASAGGVLDAPVNKKSPYVRTFQDAALDIENEGDVTDLVKTKFGFHLIKADEIRTDVEETQYKYQKIWVSTIPDPWKDTGLTGQHFIHADVQLDNLYQPYISIQFNDEGADLFEKITGENVNKPIAIFVGGQLISAPNVREKISGGQAQITGRFTPEEASNLARDLNTGAIPAPIILTGQYTIGASLGQEALDQSVWAGIIGLILLGIFMILYYRLPGLLANIALGVYAVILLFLIKSEVHLGIAVAIAIGIFVALVYKILNSKDPGWEKTLSFLLSCVVLFFITYVLRTPIVLTLAGVAGVILSIGMAVDANILIFERIKEELREGRPLGSAIDIGFDRAWSSIRDSNFSSLITCAILFYFGSSTIQGFAFNLAAGILVSMFTAITVTKTLLRATVGTKLGENLWLFGIKKEHKEKKQLRIIPKWKLWFTLSGIAIAIGIVSVSIFGLKLGLDFSGGTLMEIKFEEQVDRATLTETLAEIGTELEIPEAPAPDTEDTEEPLITSIPDEVDLKNVQVITSGEDGYIIKTKYLTTEVHDQVLLALKDKLGALEETRFTTVGPVVGETMKGKALIALGIAIIMIIIYITFAFRKIPKHVNPWRFGACAIIALVHDVLIILGIFSLLGYFLGVELDALFITALLTILGFSVHDTIVVFDRIRENLKLQERGETLADTTNRSLNQTLARSINTSISTLFTLVALLLLGSASIFYFVLALVLGVLVGTYSSIFTASPVLVLWNDWIEKKKGYQ
ncbi:protein translocase subunit SecF [Patescibacteria group bacterium]|nr:protein translocase subunit SecF [Patescibacteria group bacterium]